MFFTCHYWNKTPPRRGGWTKMWRNLRLEMRRSMRWKEFEIAWSMQKSLKLVTYQVSTTWYPEKATPRKKTPESLHRQCNTSGSWSAPFTRIILTSQQQPLLQSTPHLPWLDLQCLASAVNLPRLPSESAVDQRLPVLRIRRQKHNSLPCLQIGFPP